MQYEIQFTISQNFFEKIRSAKKVVYRRADIVDDAMSVEVARSNADRYYQQITPIVICGCKLGELEFEAYEYEEAVWPEITKHEVNALINRLVARSCDFHHIALSNVTVEGDVALVDFCS